MTVTLQRAVEAPEIVRALKSYGVTQLDIGSVAGVSDRAVRAWAQSAARPAHYDKLANLRDLVLLLSESLTAQGVGQWLHSHNRLLAGDRPIDILAAGRVQDVRHAAQAFIDGSYV